MKCRTKQTTSILGAVVAAGVMSVSAADAAPTKTSHVLAGYQNVVYRGDYYGNGYYYGEPAPTRGFWGKGTSGAHSSHGHGGHRRHR